MLQNTRFAGQPVFAQLLGLINRGAFNQLVKTHDANRYYKRCGAWEHFVCMMYAIMNNCTGLREVTQGIAAYGDKLGHLGLDYTPPRSTFSEANANRDEAFFGALYAKLYTHYKTTLADSQSAAGVLKRLFLIDSTTISLFKAILKCVGRKPGSGKSKGGIKVHTMLNAYEEVPGLIYFSEAAANDVTFLARITLNPGQIAVFDRGYVDYGQYARWTAGGIFFVTRLKDNAVYEQLEEIELPPDCPDGYLKDEKIRLRYKDAGGEEKTVVLRRVVFYDAQKDRVLQFVSNIMDMEAGQIGQIYKQRWQIELLFRQLKQNFPLKYFLGDNANAIKTQIWCTLIANLLFTVVRRSLGQKMGFSNLVSFARQHLFSYQRLGDLIGKTEREWRSKHKQVSALAGTLFEGVGAAGAKVRPSQ